MEPNEGRSGQKISEAKPFIKNKKNLDLNTFSSVQSDTDQRKLSHFH